MANVHNLIAAISPDVFCDPEFRKEVKLIVKREGYLEASKKAKLVQNQSLFTWDKAKKNPMEKWGLKSPIEQHELIYDSASESLEPLYFWLLDFLTKGGMKVEKLVDNFASSPGSGHFSEIGQKATRLQEEGMKILGATNQVVKSILNLVYDLKEFKLLLKNYEEAKSPDRAVREAALLSLKQRWIDVVDMAKRGTTSIKQMAAQFDYVTLIDAFMAVNSLKDVEELDLNDRVKRILKQRVADFLKWLEESEKELKKRFNIEKSYLKSQVNTVKLYSRWIKPYLKSVQQLEQQSSITDASLVNAFSTTIFELVLFGKSDYDPADDVNEGWLPEIFKRVNARKYYPIVILEFNFRGIPQRVSQRGDWSFGGKTIIKFTSYALNEDELKVFKEEMEKSDFAEVLKLIDGSTDESMKEIVKDVEEFLEDDNKKKKEEEKKRRQDDVNPFSSLFSFLKAEKKEEKKDLSMGIKPDNEYEKIIRSQAIIEAREKCFNAFDIYKRAHGMPAYLTPYDSMN